MCPAKINLLLSGHVRVMKAYFALKLVLPPTRICLVLLLPWIPIPGQGDRDRVIGLQGQKEGQILSRVHYVYELLVAFKLELLWRFLDFAS